MKLSSADQAVIPLEKIRDYLLSDSHPVGRLKAAFFRALGYKREHGKRLESDLRAVLVYEARAVEHTAYGQKFEVRGRITGPAQRIAEIVTA